MVSGPDGPLPNSPSFRAVSAMVGRSASKGLRGPRENDDAQTVGTSHRGRKPWAPPRAAGTRGLTGRRCTVAVPKWVPLAAEEMAGFTRRSSGVRVTRNGSIAARPSVAEPEQGSQPLRGRARVLQASVAAVLLVAARVGGTVLGGRHGAARANVEILGCRRGRRRITSPTIAVQRACPHNCASSGQGRTARGRRCAPGQAGHDVHHPASSSAILFAVGVGNARLKALVGFR
jgi:hypothetical protein